MAFDQSPSALFPSYASDGTTISIDIADLYGLTSAEANASSGDWREIALAFCATLFIHMNELAEEDAPQAVDYSVPTQAAINTGDFAGNYWQTFTFKFVIPFGSGDVVDEPA